MTDLVDINYQTAPPEPVKIDRDSLQSEQLKDPEMKALIDNALPEKDMGDNPFGFYMINGILMRKYRPQNATSNEWRTFSQVVVPPVYRNEILSIAHNTPLEVI